MWALLFTRYLYQTLRRGFMWGFIRTHVKWFYNPAGGSIYEGYEVEWGVDLSEMCEIEYCIVWFTHCVVHLVVLNNDSSTLGSTRFWVLIVYNMWSWYFFANLHVEGCLEGCILLCMRSVIVLYSIVFYCTVLYFVVLSYIVAHCFRV